MYLVKIGHRILNLEKLVKAKDVPANKQLTVMFAQGDVEYFTETERLQMLQALRDHYTEIL